MCSRSRPSARAWAQNASARYAGPLSARRRVPGARAVSGDAAGAAAHREKALEHFRRLAAILPRWKIGPVAGIRRMQERGG